MKNPFPGPQPYRAEDRARFFGRDDLSYKLQGAILGSRCVTVYGPSGAGKSSLLQASVLPALIERHDVRALRVDAWPEGKEPTRWLADAMYAELGLGELAEDAVASAAVLQAAKDAARASSRLMVIYLDQLEQLLYSGRSPAETGPFFENLEELVALPLRTVRVVLSLREDYLGRFRDRLREMRHVTENGFRVGPLGVAELTESVVATAASGEPAQSWEYDEMRGLMLQVRVAGQVEADEAEAQSAYAQIVCRALFQERVQGRTASATEAETIVQRYLDTTLADLGPLRGEAERLLEEHLVGADGSRTLRTEKELGRVIAGEGLGSILKELEAAAILRAEEHQGSRYFEIGHDWLARRVFEQRQGRERIAEQKRIEEEQRRQLEKSRAQQRRLRRIAAAAVVTTIVVGAAGVVALVARSQAVVAQKNAEIARQNAETAEAVAAKERDEANDLRIMAGYLSLMSQGNPASAMKLLAEVKKPEERAGFIAYANEALEKNALFVTLRGHRQALRTAMFSADSGRVLTASADHTAQIWRSDGKGPPIVLEGHSAQITSAAFSPDDDPKEQRVLTTSADGTARIWTSIGAEPKNIVIAGGVGDKPGQTAELTYGAWSPDGKRIVLASVVAGSADPKRPGARRKETTIVRVHAASDGAILGEHTAHEGRVHGAAFVDDKHVVTVSEDGTARVWDGVTGHEATKTPGHSAPVRFVTAHQSKRLFVTTSDDAKARVFEMAKDGSTKLVATLEGHGGAILHAAISHDGKYVATASADRTARVWSLDKPARKEGDVVLAGHGGAVTFVAFHPKDARFVATASTDKLGRVFRVDAPDEPFSLRGHGAPIHSIMWSPDGARLVTASADESQSASADHTAKIWSAGPALRLARRKRTPSAAGEGAKVTFHAAAFSDGAELYAAADDNATVELRHADGDEEPLVFPIARAEDGAFISAAAPSPDGSRVAFATLGGAATSRSPISAKLDAATPKPAMLVFDKKAPTAPGKRLEVGAAIRYIAWARSGDRVALALEDGTAMLVRVDGEEPPMVFRGHTGWLTAAIPSPDGRRLVTTSVDGTALVFDANGNAPPLEVLRHGAPVFFAAFDPRGERIATACADGKVRLFERGGGPPVVLDGKAGELVRVAFSPDGKRLAAASAKGTILVWSLLVLPFAVEPRPFMLETRHPAVALGFSRGDQELVAAAFDRTYRWKLDVAAIMADLRDEVRDCLPVDERLLYLNEAAEVAERSFRECEAAQGRGHQAQPHQSTDDMQGLILARMLVLPGAAEVELDGAPIRRRDGFVELWGKLGEQKKLRIIDGDKSIEKEVTIEAMGANPPLIDMMKELKRKEGDAAGRNGKEGEGHFDPLMPDDFQ